MGCGLSWRWSLGGLVHCREVDLVQLLADVEEGGLEDPDVLKRLEEGHLLDGQGLPGGDESCLHEIGLELLISIGTGDCSTVTDIAVLGWGE